MPRPRVLAPLWFALVLLTPALFGLPGCNSPAVPPQANYATIYGTIYDGATGKPLAGASIVVDQVLSATSGADGTYTISGVPIGPFTAQTSSSGYQPHPDSGTVGAGDRYLLNVSLYK